MKRTKTDRGFIVFTEHDYPNGNERRLLQESSAIGDYDDALDNSGSSFLWIGDHFHLNREQVEQLIAEMEYWLTNKRLRGK